MLLFNPPYVVTSEEELSIGPPLLPFIGESNNLLYKSWAGGSDGIQVLEKLLPLLPFILSKNGIFLLVASDCNNPMDLISSFKRKYHHLNTPWVIDIILKRRCGIELLSIIKFEKLY